MEVPTSLDEWSLGLILELVKSRVSEPAAFDFKSGAILGSQTGAKSLSKGACAFANSNGGFIIVGVNDRDHKWEAEGAPNDKEINKKINDRIQLEPPASYPAPKRISLPAKKGRSFYVIHIPTSDVGPHASVANGVPIFYERTHSGSMPMSWGAIRDRMLRMEERRARSRLLFHELNQQLLVARTHANTPSNNLDLVFGRFDTDVIRRLIDDLHPIVADDETFMRSASGAISQMRSFNVELSHRLAAVVSPVVRGRNDIILETKEIMRRQARTAWTAINDFLVNTCRVFDLPTPNYQGP